MERYNPFSSPTSALDMDDSSPFETNFSSSSQSAREKSGLEDESIPNNDINEALVLTKPNKTSCSMQHGQNSQQSNTTTTYTTSFPDPLGDIETLAKEGAGQSSGVASVKTPPATPVRATLIDSPTRATRFASQSIDIGEPHKRSATAVAGTSSATPNRQSSAAGTFSSFLSRATSVSSNAGSQLSDRVSGTMGGVLNAVDSLSSQIQQVVPANLNLNERLSNTATNLIGSGDQLASKLSSVVATAPFASSSTSSSLSGQRDHHQQALISRQRVILILDDPKSTDWVAKFHQYHRLLSGQSGSQSQSMLSSFFGAASGSSGSTNISHNSIAGGANSSSSFDLGAGDLIEQADYRDVSVFANQTSATAIVCIRRNRSGETNQNNQFNNQQDNTTSSNINVFSNLPKAASLLGARQLRASTRANSMIQQGSNSINNFDSFMQGQFNASGGYGIGAANDNVKIIRPEFVVVRQRASENREENSQLKGIVKALDYALIPLFEPAEIWSIFQDKQMIFAHLARIQRQLGRDKFPLIQQIHCQTHRDLMNYIQQSSNYIPMPCLVRLGPLGRGKVRVDSLEVLCHFVTILETSRLSCTIEPFLTVKYELIVQKLGTNLKIYRRSAPLNQRSSPGYTSPMATAPSVSSAQNSSSYLNFDSAFSSELSERKGTTPQSIVPNALGTSTTQSITTASAAPTTRTSPNSSKFSLANRQSSLVGSNMFSNMFTSSSDKQQSQSLSSSEAQTRRDSMSGQAYSLAAYERVHFDVNSRHRAWLDAISREFGNKLEAFSIKLLVTREDREYVVGLRDCSLEFVSNISNQEEDKRSYVELIISNMNTILPKHNHQVATQQHQTTTTKGDINEPTIATTTSDTSKQSIPNSAMFKINHNQSMSAMSSPIKSRDQYTMAGSGGDSKRAYGQLTSRSQSVSVGNQDPHHDASSNLDQRNGINSSLCHEGALLHKLPSSVSSSPYHQSSNRRSSDRTLDMNNNMDSSGFSPGFKSSTHLINDDGGSLLSDSPINTDPCRDMTTTSSSSSQLINGLGQRQASIGQSLFDSTTTAFNSFQRQSMSFFKRLDSRSGNEHFIMNSGTNTPPQSAKSDRGPFTSSIGGSGLYANSQQNPDSTTDQKHPISYRSSPTNRGDSGVGDLMSARSTGFKSQSVDGSDRILSRPSPPKPPPPLTSQSFRKARQTSLANGSSSSSMVSKNRNAFNSTPTATPNSTRQNSLCHQQSANEFVESDGPIFSSDSINDMRQRGRVVRQNSALSAFEPFDLNDNPDKAMFDSDVIADMDSSIQNTSPQAMGLASASNVTHKDSTATNPIKQQQKVSCFDTVSITSGDSTSTGDTTGTNAAEDTMKNLKKTFASILGDKPE